MNISIVVTDSKESKDYIVEDLDNWKLTLIV